MLRFKDFIVEYTGAISMASIEKEKVDLNKESTRTELNRTLRLQLDSDLFVNPYGAWMRVQKTLSMYGVNLPTIFFDDELEGEEIIAIHQFGHKFGAELNGNITPFQQTSEPEYFLYFNFGIGDSGFYEAYATIVDEQGLNSMLDKDEEENIGADDDIEN